MRYIKNYRMFESVYTIDEFVGSVSSELGNYNISPVNIRTIIDQYSNKMISAVENGETPQSFVSDIVKELELGKSGYPSIQMNIPTQRVIKYL